MLVLHTPNRASLRDRDCPEPCVCNHRYQWVRGVPMWPRTLRCTFDSVVALGISGILWRMASIDDSCSQPMFCSSCGSSGTTLKAHAGRSCLTLLQAPSPSSGLLNVINRINFSSHPPHIDGPHNFSPCDFHTARRPDIISFRGCRIGRMTVPRVSENSLRPIRGFLRACAFSWVKGIHGRVSKCRQQLPIYLQLSCTVPSDGPAAMNSHIPPSCLPVLRQIEDPCYADTAYPCSP